MKPYPHPSPSELTMNDVTTRQSSDVDVTKFHPADEMDDNGDEITKVLDKTSINLETGIFNVRI